MKQTNKHTTEAGRDISQSPATGGGGVGVPQFQEVTFVFKPVDKEKPPAFRHPFIARPGTAASVVPTASVTFDPSVSTSSAASGSTGLWLFDWLFSYNRVPKFWTHGSVCCACAQRPGLPRACHSG